MPMALAADLFTLLRASRWSWIDSGAGQDTVKAYVSSIFLKKEKSAFGRNILTRWSGFQKKTFYLILRFKKNRLFQTSSNLEHSII